MGELEYYYVNIEDLTKGDEVVVDADLTYTVKAVVGPSGIGDYEIVYTNGFKELWNKQPLVIKKNW